MLFEHGEVVFEGGRIVFVGHDCPGPVARPIDDGAALIGPGFADPDALSDLDTTILALDSQPGWRKGRVWPRDSLEAGPDEMSADDALASGRNTRPLTCAATASPSRCRSPGWSIVAASE